MDKLLEFLLKNALNIKSEIVESDEDGRIKYTIKAPSESIGLIIGKNGRTIKTLRRLLKIRATLENKRVDLFVEEA